MGKSSQADPAQRQQALALTAEPAFPTREETQPEGVPDLRLHEADVTFSPSLRSSPLTRRSLPSAQLPFPARLSTGSPPVPHGSAALPPRQDTHRDRPAQDPARYGVPPLPAPPARSGPRLTKPGGATGTRRPRPTRGCLPRPACRAPGRAGPPGQAPPGVGLGSEPLRAPPARSSRGPRHAAGGPGPTHRPERRSPRRR